MSRVLVTGAADGIGRRTVERLRGEGHELVAHARGHDRAAEAGLDPLVPEIVVGDLADESAVRDLARQVQALEPLDAVIHNAGVLDGQSLLAVNVVAPYLLTALLPRPRRWIALSSSMHAGGRARVDGLDWDASAGTSYSDTKLLVAVLGAALARRWPEVACHVVDPGWVRSRMGGPSAPASLDQGADTQSWLAVADDDDARSTGGYWLARRRRRPHPAVCDVALQDALLAALAERTGVALP